MTRGKIVTTLAVVALALGLSACGEEATGELQVLNLEPRAGATHGSQPVNIIANNWRRDISYAIFFGAKRAERFSIVDDNTLRVLTPEQTEEGTVDVVVSPDVGPAFRIHDAFAYSQVAEAAPVPGGAEEEEGAQPERRF